MKNLFKTGGIGVVILTLIFMSFFLSCCSKKNMSDILVQPDTNLVTFDSVKDMNQQIIVLKQFDSLSQIIQKQSMLIDSLSKAKTKIIYSDKMIYKEKLSSKYSDKQIDSIIQNNIALLKLLQKRK